MLAGATTRWWSGLTGCECASVGDPASDGRRELGTPGSFQFETNVRSSRSAVLTTIIQWEKKSEITPRKGELWIGDLLQLSLR